MKQVIQSYRTGELTVEDVPAPQCKPGGVLVRNVFSLISAGTERGVIELGKKSLVGKAMARPDLVRRALDKARREGLRKTFQEAMGRLDTPIALGYSSAGVVIEVGARVTDLSVGTGVACIGAGFASHGEIVWVPRNLCAPIPEEVSFEEAAYGMLGIIALHGVRCAKPELGQKVVVLGLGLLGQLAVQELAACGTQVFGIDIDPWKVALAKELGAQQGALADRNGIQRVLEFTGGVGADAVVITAAAKDSAPITLATDLCARGGRIVLVGVCNIQIDRQLFWEKEIRFMVSKASGPGTLDEAYEVKGQEYPQELVRWSQRRNLAAFLELVRDRKVNVGRLTTHRFPIERAIEAYDLVLHGREPFLGALLSYPEKADTQRTIRYVQRPLVGNTNILHIGVIGAGLFAKALLIPALARAKGVRLATLATTNGVNCHHIARKFGFEQSTTDYDALLADEKIDAVVILTRHNLHSQMVEKALVAGKHVFVEKPLCMTEEELDRVAAAYMAAGGRTLMVGYNRRFSPITQQCVAFFEGRKAPATLVIRVNAGAVPREHWAHSTEEGGGRLVSEGCHFFDMAMVLTGERPLQVFARAVTSPYGQNLGDEIAALLMMDGGSVAQILYTGAGDRSFSRERYEIFSGGACASIEDFKVAEMCRDNRRRVVRKRGQDLGYDAEIAAFIRGIHEGRPPVPFDDFAASTLATLRAVHSIETGRPLDCAWKGFVMEADPTQ